MQFWASLFLSVLCLPLPSKHRKSNTKHQMVFLAFTNELAEHCFMMHTKILFGSVQGMARVLSAGKHLLISFSHVIVSVYLCPVIGWQTVQGVPCLLLRQLGKAQAHPQSSRG